MEISTERLLLRPLARTDLDAVFAYMSDPEVCRHTVAGPDTREQTLAFLESIDPPRGDHAEFAIIERETGDLVGHVGYEPSGPERSELGWILRRDRWGRGYATEAAQPIADLASRIPGVVEVIARCRPENEASERIMLKLGMSLVRRLAGDVVIDGVRRDSQLYSRRAP